MNNVVARARLEFMRLIGKDAQRKMNAKVLEAAIAKAIKDARCQQR